MADVQGGWVYSETVKDHFMNPRNVLTGDEEEYEKEADGVGLVGNPVCGDMMKVWIKVDKKNEKIKEFKWKTFGCASAIGSTSMLSVMVTENEGMTVDEALKITPPQIIQRLGGLPSRKIHCSVLGDKALRAAINDYFQRTGQTHRIVQANPRIVCECLHVTLDEIENLVQAGVRDFETLQERTKLGTGCGECIPDAKKILESLVAKIESKQQ